jgi:hypothetical protein
MALVRGFHEFESEYTQIPNRYLRDKELSLAAIGLLAQIMSHRPGWKITQETLAQANGIGRDAMRTLLKELIKAGYLHKSAKRERNDAGQLAGYTYTTKEPQAVEPTLDEPTQAEPTQADPTLKNNIIKNNIDKKNNKENRAAKLPPDWVPGENLIEMFETKWPGLLDQREYQIEQFRLYWLASGRPMKNWDLAFQKWMNTEQQRASKSSDQDRLKKEWGTL